MPSPDPVPYTLDLDYKGFIRGQTHSSSLKPSSPIYHSFTGLPYAQPPTGNLRFLPPKPLEPCYKYGTRTTPFDASKPCGVCPQPVFSFSPPPPSSFSTSKIEKAEATWDEDCLQLNVFLPASRPRPPAGWPIVVHYHGGFLQFGTPNSISPAALLTPRSLGGAGLEAMLVVPAYRLNAFGFLCSSVVVGAGKGNMGLWDQRLALEWVWKHASYFGANASEISIMGHSAGAYSVFHQLSYDLWRAEGKRIVKRALLLSNGPGVQPKTLAQGEEQAAALFRELGLDGIGDPADKWDKLKGLSALDIIKATERIEVTEFRAVTDGAFVRRNLFEDIDSGAYARRLEESGVQILLGDLPDEHNVYLAWRPPPGDGISALRRRLCADYPVEVVDAVMEKHYFAGAKDDADLPGVVADGEVGGSWSQAFGRAYADLQVHALQRGFVDALVRGGAARNVGRYRIEWRAKCTEKAIPKEAGVTHGTDVTGIWFWGNSVGGGLDAKEAASVHDFAGPIWRWLQGRAIDGAPPANWKVPWRLKADGEVDEWIDWDWQRGLEVWRTVRDAQVRTERRKATKL